MGQGRISMILLHLHLVVSPKERKMNLCDVCMWPKFVSVISSTMLTGIIGVMIVVEMVVIIVVVMIVRGPEV